MQQLHDTLDTGTVSLVAGGLVRFQQRETHARHAGIQAHVLPAEVLRDVCQQIIGPGAGVGEVFCGSGRCVGFKEEQHDAGRACIKVGGDLPGILGVRRPGLAGAGSLFDGLDPTGRL